jgi:hypothetical protein
MQIDQSIYTKKNDHPVPPGFILTPGGYRHRSRVHHVPTGHRLRRRNGILQLVQKATGRIVERYDPAPEDAMIPGTGTGWVAYASWQNNTDSSISQIATNWTVPNDPTDSAENQLFFLFNALQDSEKSNLVQPVLQWGSSDVGGGNYWCIANWYIDSGGSAHYGNTLPVLPGQALTGMISLLQENNGLFSYTSSFFGYNGLDLQTPYIGELVWASIVLESYRIGDASEYPPDDLTAMSQIAISAGGTSPILTWQKFSNPTTCGESCDIVTSANPGGQINISYRSPV